MSAKKIEYTDNYGTKWETSALVIRVANAAILAHEGQTITTDELGDTIESAYRLERGRAMTFNSYMHARRYIEGTITLDGADGNVTIPSILDQLTNA